MKFSSISIVVLVSWCAVCLSAISEGDECNPRSMASIGQVDSCVQRAKEVIPKDVAKLLHKAIEWAHQTHQYCGQIESRNTQIGCIVLTQLQYSIIAWGSTLVSYGCFSSSTEEAYQDLSHCFSLEQEAIVDVSDRWRGVERKFKNTPLDFMVTHRLQEMRDQWPGQPTENRGLWDIAYQVVFAMGKYTQWFIWRETHWLWLTDSIAAGKVVQTEWGDAERWDEFGDNDARSEAPFIPADAPPLYTFSDRFGMRWDLLIGLLKELHKLRGEPEELVVVEVGVFAAHLSQMILERCNFVRLIGVDPYVGKDGTFPGKFSQTLDPEVAAYKAQLTFDRFGSRAELWATTSEIASAAVPDHTVDVIFLDGCHLYDCIVDDFAAWVPKLRQNSTTLVAGHDFSPMWPGVVRAVHEKRYGGREVNLGMDWMYWWFEDARTA